jgi:hypothetical protein
MDKKTIYCPNCQRKVMQYDGKSTNLMDVMCRNCKVLVVYNPVNNITFKRNVPERTTASGMRFY